MAAPGDDAPEGADAAGAADASADPAPRGPRFLGAHPHRLDEKGRVFLPAKFRDRLAGGLVITPGQERCLYVFPESEFDRIFERIRQAPVSSKKARDYQRMFLSKASDPVPDKQGRVKIEPGLQRYAGLRRDCVVVGAGTRIEIWDAQSWETYDAEQEGPFAELSEEVLPGLF